MKKLLPMILVWMLAGLHIGCLDRITEAPLTVPGAEIAAPEGLSARIGDGEITLGWDAVGGAMAYRVYRSVDAAGRFEPLAEVTSTEYRDADVQNGRSYFYSVSAVAADQLEGKRSVDIVAIPALYSILIDGGEAATGSAIVTLSLTGPQTTELMMIGADPAFHGGVWESYAAERAWKLDGPDGQKRVYAAFRDGSGALSPVVCDSIVLDTYAMITGIEITPTPRVYRPGAAVHFAMHVEDNETGGKAWVAFGGFTARVDLYDDGRGGDTSANDGVYEADYRLAESIRGTDIVVTGNFADHVGNAAPPFECEDRISSTEVPSSVQLFGAVDSSTASITIKWGESQDEHFRSYRLYRRTSAGVTESPANLVVEIRDAAQTSYVDGGLREGSHYYYRVFVVNDLNETAGSNEVSARTFDAYPAPAALENPSSVGNGRATLVWSQNANTDFKEYRLYRSTQPGVTMSSTLVVTITDQARSYYDDSGLDLVGNTYYYRVYVVDLGGKNSRSNEVDTATAP